MKKLLAALLCAMMIGSAACAEGPVFPTPTPAPEASPNPEPPSESASTGSMNFTINGENIVLDFDPRPEYSLYQDGYLQASFYAYDAANQLYELYVTFPQTVASGDTFTPADCLTADRMGTGVMLFISDDYGKDVCSAASQLLTGPYPEGSSYKLTFSSVTANGTATTFAGTLEASLAEVDYMYRATGVVNQCTATFEFTMDAGASATPKDSQPAPDASQAPSDALPELPESTPEIPALPKIEYPPLPPETLVTPPDARSI